MTRAGRGSLLQASRRRSILTGMESVEAFAGILSELSIGEARTSALLLSTPWAAASPGSGHPGLYVMTSGTAYIRVPGGAAHRLEAGDVAVLPRGSAHVLASRPADRAVSIAEFCAEASVDVHGNVVGGGGGSASSMRTLCFRLESPAAKAVAAFAPPIVVLRGGEQEPWLTHVGRALADVVGEAAAPSAVTRRLAEILFTTALRRSFSRSLAGPADRAVAAAILLVHADPSGPWTSGSLARRVGLSRSSFCARFGSAMGCGPAHYVARARMEHAAHLLAQGAGSIEQIAEAVGYASASAFSVAFRRWHGTSPARFSRSR
jgi:AraC-like DNA-binding protein